MDCTNKTVLRGHKFGVTSLAYCVISGVPYLISGDESGAVVVWNLKILRMSFNSHEHNSRQSIPKIKLNKTSRIQSLRVIKLCIKSDMRDILVIQSRDDGITLLDLNDCLGGHRGKPSVHGTFETAVSIFSRGDAINLDENRAILAYPSVTENYLVTIRILGNDAETQLSGTAQRNIDANRTNCSVFDIVIKENPSHKGLLFVAYGDGYICIFSFNPELTTTVPVLNIVGLKVEFLKSINLNIGDFVTAYDVLLGQEGKITTLCGSHLRKIIVSDQSNTDADATLTDIVLPKRGTAVITIRPDCELFAAACWDTVVRLYSMKSFAHLGDIKLNCKVLDLLFIERPDIYPPDDSQLDQGETLDKYRLCCATSEGTISISAFN